MAAGGLDVAATIDVVEEALRLHAEGDTRLPSKSALLWSDELGSEEKDGRIMAMPAYVGGSVGLVGLKWIPSVPSNPSRGLPRGIGLIVLSDPRTGLPVAVMDGTIVSAVRTGAVTGVTARRLARPGAHPRSSVARPAPAVGARDQGPDLHADRCDGRGADDVASGDARR